MASLTLHWGDEKSLTNREAACSYAGGMLMRGTKKHSRAELKDAFDKLNAAVSVGGDGASDRGAARATWRRRCGWRPRCCASRRSPPPSSTS